MRFTDRAVSRRVAAPQTAPPPHLRPLAAAVLALGLLPAFGAADATGDLLELPEHALTHHIGPTPLQRSRPTSRSCVS
ncbi:hypothetical protein [Streptomyces cellostaticus]|uniref:hypothetical protein n=1 Tax=Streptomyces cellostaticus TaxID=67285 RepID=UPI00295E7AB4|nr:hypothetical protein [Streptomyces cellostaticus]